MKHYRRDWLNKKKGTAFVESHTSDHFPTNKKISGHVSASLTIADCSRTISLDFDCFDKEDVDERLHKIAVLRTHLNEIVNALLEAKGKLLTRKENKALDKEHALDNL